MLITLQVSQAELDFLELERSFTLEQIIKSLETILVRLRLLSVDVL